MKNRIEELLDKYWEGSSNLADEKELKDLLQNSEGFEPEKSFFLGISKITAKEPMRLQKPVERSLEFTTWLKMAAAFLVLLISGWVLFDQQKKQAEREAFEKVMQAFDLIQVNMEKGTNSLQIMEEFKHLGVTEELFNIQENKE
ncbi:hypothetical protein EF405_17610 [Cyclobacteriaceae bacterium YHN15]|jgi:hypothetical protein|nr:hypothetical protein EF405_17610 [Cyclobacteriaceae bacterium YHN15]